VEDREALRVGDSVRIIDKDSQYYGWVATLLDARAKKVTVAIDTGNELDEDPIVTLKLDAYSVEPI
jgi:hypothetical protein